ncbi:hypothetical protein [Goodfellowiella coeruleoviolacea]|uniref:Uncharacterized protein n=1 Tax=Goodfellowiella coeruleoviolacea TaxID=334858 RepID=A0AAE3KI51_9PSEU|nr:hypothetical protein [Goodfellowiella coeruleoviolacea]MCP2168110.1 hypothetical protein [Goodfellowiella coeruleoviolacea]
MREWCETGHQRGAPDDQMCFSRLEQVELSMHEPTPLGVQVGETTVFASAWLEGAPAAVEPVVCLGIGEDPETFRMRPAEARALGLKLVALADDAEWPADLIPPQAAREWLKDFFKLGLQAHRDLLEREPDADIPDMVDAFEGLAMLAGMSPKGRDLVELVDPVVDRLDTKMLGATLRGFLAWVEKTGGAQ